MELFFSSLPPLLLAAIKVSIPLAVISFIFGVGIAVITALARLSNNAILKFIFMAGTVVKIVAFMWCALLNC